MTVVDIDSLVWKEVIYTVRDQASSPVSDKVWLDSISRLSNFLFERVIRANRSRRDG